MDNGTLTMVRWHARQIADSIIFNARTSGDDPIVFVTGNSYVPPLRSFALAEQVWELMYTTSSGQDAYALLEELVERYLDDADVALECPEYDDALYAVDLARFEYRENDAAQYLQDDWFPVTSEWDAPAR
jgi:hypothetical protein